MALCILSDSALQNGRQFLFLLETRMCLSSCASLSFLFIASFTLLLHTTTRFWRALILCYSTPDCAKTRHRCSGLVLESVHWNLDLQDNATKSSCFVEPHKSKTSICLCDGPHDRFSWQLLGLGRQHGTHPLLWLSRVGSCWTLREDRLRRSSIGWSIHGWNLCSHRSSISGASCRSSIGWSRIHSLWRCKGCCRCSIGRGSTIGGCRCSVGGSRCSICSWGCSVHSGRRCIPTWWHCHWLHDGASTIRSSRSSTISSHLS